MSKLRILGLAVIGLGAVSAYFHGGTGGILFACVCLIVGLVLMVAPEARGLVSKPGGAQANPGERKQVQIMVLVKGEVHVYPQRDGKFQEIHDLNQSGFDFELFIYGWLVHGAELSVGIDDLYLTLNGTDGSRRVAERVAGDLKDWHLRGGERGSEEESDWWAPMIRTKPAPLLELDTAAPLECGAPREGWLHFRIRNSSPSELTTGSLELTVWDTFSQTHTAVASRVRRLPGNVWPIAASSPSEPDSKKDEPPEVADGKLAN